MRELDKSGLEFVKKDCEKRLNKLEQWIQFSLLWIKTLDIFYSLQMCENLNKYMCLIKKEINKNVFK